MTRPLHVARLTGTQEEMGAQHGRLVADDARRLLQFYRTMPERQLVGGEKGLGGAAAKAIVSRLATAWMSRLVRERPADQSARAKAFAAAAGTPADAELAYATMDAMQNCVSMAARAGLGPFTRPIVARLFQAAAPACSTVIAWGKDSEDGELLFARNFDFPGVGVWDEAPAFTVCKPDRGQSYAFFGARGADTPVVTVVNEAGLVLAPHTRWHRGVQWGGAMIVDLVHEIARRAETVDDAIRIARERTISSTWGLAIGSAREKTARVLEIAGKQLEIVRPASGADHLVCCNRYRTASLQDGQLAGSAAWAIHSERRERRLRALVAAKTAPLSPKDLVAFLSDRVDVDSGTTVRRHLGAMPAQPVNVHCAVVKPAARSAWVGVDRAPVCEGEWAHLAWSWDGPAGAYPAGIDVKPSDIAPPQDDATKHVYDMARVYESTHDVPAARAALDRAITSAPDDPSLQLAALWLALEDKDVPAAVVHAREGLARETERYRRGQLLLWGSRAATGDERERWLTELRATGHEELVAASKKRWNLAKRPHINLMMQDAF